jgi:hypothetical protein
LNVTEFFRKLEIKSPAYFEIINNDRSYFEEEIRLLIEEEFGSNLESITFWGEGRYACGNVIKKVDGEDYVIVLGMYKMENQNPQSYRITFIPEGKELKNVTID